MGDDCEHRNYRQKDCRLTDTDVTWLPDSLGLTAPRFQEHFILRNEAKSWPTVQPGVVSRKRHPVFFAGRVMPIWDCRAGLPANSRRPPRQVAMLNWSRYSPHLARSMKSSLRAVCPGIVLTTAFLGMPVLPAGEVRMLRPGEESPITGKEIDWIYGDYLLRNDRISLIIAAPKSTRDANMTIRSIGGSVLDLSLNNPSNDQLSAYTPTSGRYRFEDQSLVAIKEEGNAVVWECASSRTIAKDGTTATVRYRLHDGNAFVESTITIQGGQATQLRAYDGIRADGWFDFEDLGSVAYCTDSFFRQTIGFVVPGAVQPPSWKRGRPYQLRYLDQHVKRGPDRLAWTVRLYPATSPIDLHSAVNATESVPQMCQFQVVPRDEVDTEMDSVLRAEVKLCTANVESEDDGEVAKPKTFRLQTDDSGVAMARLAPGAYVATVNAIGYAEATVDFDWPTESGRISLPLGAASGFEAQVANQNGDPIPVKATIYSVDGDPPDFGPSSARTFVENCVYSVRGRFFCPLDPGRYEIFFSRGPEHDSVTRRIDVLENEVSSLQVRLNHVVQTIGWVSADLHSHSSPSGDNTSDQYGRVENLLCEHVEFAPCTEHNRVSSYSPHLREMNRTGWLATCTGIELTGSPTPVNHQNAFPLPLHRHTQNGGGPRPASNPVVQIERLALFDSAAEKLVQMNHPDLRRIYGDLDDDGSPDQGFKEMLKWTDVIEVHPLETIFQDVVNDPPVGRRKRIALFHWMQLLNQGIRIPGLVNTDSHYNHHGSGWRRNWLASSVDDPANISTNEMIHQAKAGHIIMSTGPFLQVNGRADGVGKTAMPGDDLDAPGGEVVLDVTVQCPNWMDVNRVQLFINGRPSPEHHYTRGRTPEFFGEADEVLKFNASLGLVFNHDAHVIVATIGEGVTMERVMGRRNGSRPPIAVSNPIFIDVNENGFEPNGDELGMPLPRVEELQ